MIFKTAGGVTAGSFALDGVMLTNKRRNTIISDKFTDTGKAWLYK